MRVIGSVALLPLGFGVLELTIQENDEPKQTLLAESATQFFSTTSDDLIRFESDAQGHVTHLILHTDGRDIRVPRQ